MSDPRFPRATLPPELATTVVAAEAAEFERLRDAAQAALSEVRRLRGMTKDAEQADRAAFANAAATGKKPPTTSHVDTHRAELNAAERIAQGHADAATAAHKALVAAVRARADTITTALHETDQTHRADLADTLRDAELHVDAIDEVAATRRWVDRTLDEDMRMPASYTRRTRTELQGLGGRFDTGTTLAKVISTMQEWTGQTQDAA